MLGNAGTERNAYDVIDNLFNRPQWANEAPRNAIVVNPVQSGWKGHSPPKGKEKEKEGWFKIGGAKGKFNGNAPIPSPTRTTFHHQTPRPLSVISIPPPATAAPPQLVARPSLQPPSRRQNSFPLVSHRTSTASSLHSGKAKSILIRWDDDETVGGGLKASLPPSRITSSTSLCRMKDDAEAEEGGSETEQEKAVLKPPSRALPTLDKGVKFMDFGPERMLAAIPHS